MGKELESRIDEGGSSVELRFRASLSLSPLELEAKQRWSPVAVEKVGFWLLFSVVRALECGALGMPRGCAWEERGGDSNEEEDSPKHGLLTPYGMP